MPYPLDVWDKLQYFIMACSEPGFSLTLLETLRAVIIMQTLTHLSLAPLLWDIGKQNSLRCDATERGVPSGAILFAKRIFI